MITPILIKGGAALTATAAMLAGAPVLNNAFGSSEPAAMPVSWANFSPAAFHWA